jgi:hypothetical protein
MRCHLPPFHARYDVAYAEHAAAACQFAHCS